MTLLTAQHQPLENTMSHHRTRHKPQRLHPDLERRLTLQAAHIAEVVTSWETSLPATLLRLAQVLPDDLVIPDPGADAPVQTRIVYQTFEAARHYNAGRPENVLVALEEGIALATFIVERTGRPKMNLGLLDGTPPDGLLPAWQALLDEIFAVAGTAVRLASPVGEA